MTYVEVIEEINAFNKRHEENYQEQMRLRANMDYQLAQLIGIAFNDPKKYPTTLQKAYPDLFNKQSKKMTWQENKEQLKMYAAVHNQQRGG
jgi:hypothetical protein